MDCPHLVSENYWLGTATKRCCVHTLSTWDVTLRGCPNLVPGNQWLGTGTKLCCVHTLSTSYVTLRCCPHLVLGNQCLGTGTKWCCVHNLNTRYVTDCVHSYSISPCQTPFWNMSWAARAKQWNAQSLQKLLHTGTRCPLLCPSTRTRPCTLAPAPCPNSSVGMLEKKVCSHWCPVGTVLGHRARAPSVNAA